MRTNKNEEVIIGRIYQHNLTMRKVERTDSPNYGKDFINGTLDVAIDDAGREILQVHYTYVTEVTKTGKANGSFNSLKRIIESGKTIIEDGIEAATKVRLTPSAALNDFYPRGSSELVSTPRHEGGFVTIINDLPPEGPERHKFKFDTLITGVKHVDANPERGIEADYAEIKCAIFNFRNDILPFTLVIKNPAGVKYFESLDATPSNPVYTSVEGRIDNKLIMVEKKIESAFGDDAVEMSQRRVREWVVTSAAKVPYEFGVEGVMTAAEVTKALENRNIMLADVKRRNDEYNARPVATPAASTGIPEGGFKF